MFRHPTALLIAMLLQNTIAFSQDKIFSYPIADKAELIQGKNVYNKAFFSLSQNDSLLIFSEKSDRNFEKVYSTNIKDSNNKTFRELSKKTKKLSSLLTDTSLLTTLYFKDNYYHKYQIYFVSMNTNSGNIYIQDTINIERDEELVTSYTTDSCFYILSCFRKTNQLILYTKKIGQPSFYRSYEIDNLKFGKQYSKWPLSLNTKIKNLYQQLDKPYMIVEPNVEYPLSLMMVKNKFYFNQNLLTITIDNEELKTLIIQLPLSDTSFSVKEISNKVDAVKFKINKSVSNSFLLDSTLIQTNISRGVFHLTYHNINTGAELKTYRLDANDSISFTSPIVQKGNFFSSKKESEISLRRMLYTLTDNVVAFGITVTKKDSLYNIAIGGQYTRVDATRLVLGSTLFFATPVNPFGPSLTEGFWIAVRSFATALVNDYDAGNMIRFSVTTDFDYKLSDKLYTPSLKRISDFMKEKEHHKNSPVFYYPSTFLKYLGFRLEKENEFSIFAF